MRWREKSELRINRQRGRGNLEQDGDGGWGEKVGKRSENEEDTKLMFGDLFLFVNLPQLFVTRNYGQSWTKVQDYVATYQWYVEIIEKSQSVSYLIL